MTGLILGALVALSVGAVDVAAEPVTPMAQGEALVLPLVSQADTSSVLSSEATRALVAELRKSGFAVASVDPTTPAGKDCLSHQRGAVRACAAAASASGARYAFAGSLYAYSFKPHANLPIRMSVTLLDVDSGQPVWTRTYGAGPRGDFSRAVSAYGDVQLGARALVNSLVADPAAARLLVRQD